MPTKEKTRTVDIGLEDDKREELVSILNGFLADEVTLYQKTRNYHWNVTGPHFHSLHKFLEEQYEQLAENADEVAEWTRRLGGFAVGTLTEYVKNTRLAEHPGKTLSAQEMLRDLTNDHQTVIKALREEVDHTDELGAADVTDFLTGLLEQHEKMAWMLRAHFEEA